MMTTTPQLIAVTGGIGSGKSVVCRVLRTLGYPVFDCDCEARDIMDSDRAIHDRLRSDISEEVVHDGVIDRRLMASIVFADAAKLAALNDIVHGAVRARLAQWHSSHTGDAVFVETAIFFQSGLNRMTDAEWRVTAPEDVRIQRVMRRNGLTADQVRARIKAQHFEPDPLEHRPELTEIVNDGQRAVLPQILAATDRIITL
ncbi:MAG: dephospho-CoA kinase [Muribaculaceae bacterium]|nr:dephospho-CoA kinase [Muribaculaceae bacterium]